MLIFYILKFVIAFNIIQKNDDRPFYLEVYGMQQFISPNKENYLKTTYNKNEALEFKTKGANTTIQVINTDKYVAVDSTSALYLKKNGSDKFKFEQNGHFYKIKKSNKCLTLNPNDTYLSLEACGNSNTQLFEKYFSTETLENESPVMQQNDDTIFLENRVARTGSILNQSQKELIDQYKNKFN